MPWILPDFKLTDDIGRPVDQIAGGMDPRGRVHPEPPEWAAAQLLTAEQGLRAVTLDAAWALGDEARRGHLAPGTLGDVTILCGDVTDRHARRDPGHGGHRHHRRRGPRLLRRARSLLPVQPMKARAIPSTALAPLPTQPPSEPRPMKV